MQAANCGKRVTNWSLNFSREFRIPSIPIVRGILQMKTCKKHGPHTFCKFFQWIPYGEDWCMYGGKFPAINPALCQWFLTLKAQTYKKKAWQSDKSSKIRVKRRQSLALMWELLLEKSSCSENFGRFKSTNKEHLLFLEHLYSRTS